MGLDDLRKTIDAIDDEVLVLLEKRAVVVGDIAEAKRVASLAPYDPERERRVLARLEARAGRFPKEAVRAVFREVMSACLALQEPLRVAFLGPAGSFGHAAARELFGLAVRYTETTTNEGVFDAIRRGHATYGVVPIENSTEGSVTGAVDALIEGGIFICAEVVYEVAQCLMTLASGLTSIERVYSHPQALGQCRTWLGQHLPNAQLVQTSSTAAAVRDALADPTGAAIGGRMASELYGVPILRERIQDRPDNATRFVMIAKEDAPRTGHDKTTIAFAVRDGRGQLRRVLDIFDDLGLNLTHIESRPSRQKAWDYVFLADLEGHRDDEPVKGLMTSLEAGCAMVRHLGSYPRWVPAAPDVKEGSSPSPNAKGT
jgi:chorismate mutase/prephenate dehydratase